MKFFEFKLIETKVCKVCKTLHLKGGVCKSKGCRATRKAAR